MPSRGRTARCDGPPVRLAGDGQSAVADTYRDGEISERVTACMDRWHGVAESWQADGRKAFERLYRDGVQVSETRVPQQEDEYAATLIPGTRTLVFASTRPFAGLARYDVALWTADLPDDAP